MNTSTMSLNRAKKLLDAAEDQTKRGGNLSKAAVLGSLAATWTAIAAVEATPRDDAPRHRGMDDFGALT